MQTITPPPRRKVLAAVDPDAHEGVIIDSEQAFSTPLARDARGFSWHHGHEGVTSVMVPPAGTVPATPQTSLESNDGSHIKTPFSNLPPWSGGSPDIASTPTPNGVYSKIDVGRMFPSIGNGPGFPTPQYPTDLPSLTSRQGPESPLATKARLSQLEAQNKVTITSSESLSRGSTPEEAIVKPLILTTDPVQPTQLMASEGEESSESPDLLSPPLLSSLGASPVIAPEGNENLNEALPTTHFTKSSVELSTGVHRWLESPYRIQTERRFTSGPDRERREQVMRRRLSAFIDGNGLPPPLEPTNHANRGRVVHLRPKENASDEIFAAPNWPDHVYPWTLSSHNGTNNSQRRRELKMIANYLDSDSGSEEEAQVPAGQVDPSDALVVLRNKAATRRWVQRRHATPSKAPRASSLPVVNEPADVGGDNEMDVDKDSGETACICRKPDDGREMVQCDACKTWHHVECVTKDPLPEKWFCWNCPTISTPEKGTNIIEPTFSVVDSPVKNRFSTAANVPLYQAPSTSSQSPRRGSHSSTHLTSSSLFEPGGGSLFDDKHTPSPSHGGLSRYPFGTWPDNSGNATARPSTDKLDDPMTAIAVTPFSSIGFLHNPYEDPTFDSLSPSRHLGLRFTPIYGATPKKERPWTNYTGTFTTPTNAADSQYTTFPNQGFPTVQTDPLFIHYEHDAPKQTAHHNGGPAKGKRKGRNKGKGKQASSEKTDGSSTHEASRAEVSEATANERSGSEPIGDTPPPEDQTAEEMIEIKSEA